MRVVASNFSAPLPVSDDYEALWASTAIPDCPRRASLFEQPFMWGFHITALGVYLMDCGRAQRVELWDYQPRRRMRYTPGGALEVHFHNAADVAAYLDRTGPPDLIVNFGFRGLPVLRMLEGRSFRVHVPTLRAPTDPLEHAECFLLDAQDQLVERSMLYIPVVNTEVVRPRPAAPERDFVYLATCYAGKRHDLLVDAVRGTELTGHLHPVPANALDLTRTRITTSDWDERDVVDLLQTSRIAVYPGDHTSNPAAMWECVAAGLPIVVNDAIEGGRHVVVPGVTGELASEERFLEVMRAVLTDRPHYSPREHFLAHWDTVTLLERYLAFFRRMGWTG
ncbi:MAG: hypothetical protein AMXMBFR46_13020 [Acidimicrobiia bacterium]